MRVVVTGGAGFIGANTARKLREHAHDVVVLDDMTSGSSEHLAGLGAEVFEGSILDSELLAKACQGADAVIHLAAMVSVPLSVDHPRRCHEVNATGTLLVLETARSQGAHVITASSAAIYGSDPRQPKVETHAPAPASPYAVSKLATEAYTTTYASCYGTAALALRFFNVYGPLQRPDHAYAAVIPAFVSAALSGRSLVVHGDGTQTRDFVHVDTVTDVLRLAVERRLTSSTPVNLASGSPTSLLDLAQALEAIVGHPLTIERAPARAGDVQHSRADVTALKRLVPDLRPVALEDGLRSTWEWMREAPTQSQAPQLC